MSRDVLPPPINADEDLFVLLRNPHPWPVWSLHVYLKSHLIEKDTAIRLKSESLPGSPVLPPELFLWSVLPNQTNHFHTNGISWLQKHRISAQASPPKVRPLPQESNPCVWWGQQYFRHLIFARNAPLFVSLLGSCVQREGISRNKQILMGMPNIQKSWTNGCCAGVDKPEVPWHGQPDVPGAHQLYSVSRSGKSVPCRTLAAFSGTFRAFKCTRVGELFLGHLRCPHDYMCPFAAAANFPVGCTDLAITPWGMTWQGTQIFGE